MSTDTQAYTVQCENNTTLQVMARDEPEAMYIAQSQTDAHVSSAKKTEAMSTDTDSQARRLVDAQAKDHGLWFQAGTAPEGYLQEALRALHAAVEADETGQRKAQQEVFGLRLNLTSVMKRSEKQTDELQASAEEITWLKKKLRYSEITRRRIVEDRDIEFARLKAEIVEGTKELTEDVSVLQDICRKLEGREKDLRLALTAIAEEGCEYEGSHPTCNLAPGDYNGCSPCISAAALEGDVMEEAS